MHCSECEVNAEKAERYAMKLMACKFMEGKENQYFSGTISGITKFGLFVELKDFPVEGLVPRRSLRFDHYIFDEERLQVIGATNRKRFTIGQEVTVIHTRTATRKLQIDFQIVL
jgi:exoribonuclease R